MKCVYKLKCRDKEITEFYIGSSMDFYTRKRKHKTTSINLNNSNYCIPLYMFINVNGGYDNWEYEIIKEYKFITKKELTINEQYYKDLLKPKLNSINAFGVDMERYKNKIKRNNDKNNNNIKDNCPQCGKEMVKRNINKHLKICKKVKLQPKKCGYEYPGWEWDEGIPWK